MKSRPTSTRDRLRSRARQILMFLRRRRHGLTRVHRTFYLAAGSRVCRDLVACEYSYVGPECRIGPQVEIGPYSMLGPRVSIVGADHRFDRPGTPMIFSGRPPLYPTVIEADAWIGSGTTLMAGVRIGRGAIVAAGAVVTRNVPPYEIHGGVPAQKIRDRFPNPADREIHDRMLREPPRRGDYCRPLEEATAPNARSTAKLALAGFVGLLILGVCLRLIR